MFHELRLVPFIHAPLQVRVNESDADDTLSMPHEDAMTIKDTRITGLLHRIHWKPMRFVQLLIFIVLVMLLSPFLRNTPFLHALLSVFFLNILMVTLSFAGFDVRWRWLLILLWFAGSLCNIAASRVPDITQGKALAVASEILGAVLIVFCVTMILRYVLTSREVTTDTIFGAVVAYFLIAFMFSSLYQVVAIVEPASFSMPTGPDITERNTRNIEFGYFSFVTIATLGYGDIVPRLPAARILSILEAATGQFYMAVVVAWLVSAHAGGRKGTGGGRGSGNE